MNNVEGDIENNREKNCRTSIEKPDYTLYCQKF